MMERYLGDDTALNAHFSHSEGAIAAESAFFNRVSR